MNDDNYVSSSFSYIVAPDNDSVALPNGIYSVLAELFNSGYLNIKPTKVSSQHSNNGNDDTFGVYISFDTEDKCKIENTMEHTKNINV